MSKTKTLPIRDYMIFRAKNEKLAHNLTNDFYQAAMDKGMRGFFGVEVDDAGMPLTDSQNPAALKKWKSLKFMELVEGGEGGNHE